MVDDGGGHHVFGKGAVGEGGLGVEEDDGIVSGELLIIPGFDIEFGVADEGVVEAAADLALDGKVDDGVFEVGAEQVEHGHAAAEGVGVGMGVGGDEDAAFGGEELEEFFGAGLAAREFLRRQGRPFGCHHTGFDERSGHGHLKYSVSQFIGRERCSAGRSIGRNGRLLGTCLRRLVKCGFGGLGVAWKMRDKL